jgi:hypothetical protein
MKRSHDSPSSPVNPTRSHPTNPASRHGATSGPTGPCSMGDTAAETTLMDSSLGFTMALPPGAITRLETGSYEAPCLFDDQEWASFTPCHIAPLCLPLTVFCPAGTGQGALSRV